MVYATSYSEVSPARSIRWRTPPAAGTIVKRVPELVVNAPAGSFAGRRKEAAMADCE
jgi:hypothetical protein